MTDFNYLRIMNDIIERSIEFRMCSEDVTYLYRMGFDIDFTQPLLF